MEEEREDKSIRSSKYSAQMKSSNKLKVNLTTNESDDLSRPASKINSKNAIGQLEEVKESVAVIDEEDFNFEAP